MYLNTVLKAVELNEIHRVSHAKDGEANNKA
jgi:hypothetical protein